MLLRATVVSFLVLLSARADAQTIPQTFVGCYLVQQGTWDSRLTPGFHPSPSRLPMAIELDSVVFPNPHRLPFLNEALAVHSRALPGDPVHRFGAWRRRADGSLTIGVSALLLVGFDMTVAPVDGTLRGEVRAFTDVASRNPPSEVSAPVTLVAVPCDSASTPPRVTPLAGDVGPA